MISNAFKGAYTERVGAENKVAGNIQAGIRDAASIATIAALGFTGAISDEAILKGVSRMGASRLGGIGGNAVMAALGEKKDTAQVRKDDTRLLNADEEELDKIFTELSNQSTSEEMDTAIDTVWQKLNQGNKKKLNDKIKLNLQLFSEKERNEPKGYFNESETESIESKVQDRMGKTYNWNETGYITTDGTRIDLSGKNQGARGGSRTIDHRDIFESEDINGEHDRTQSMVEFMKRGNIRVNPEYPGVNLSIKEPTKEQYDLIQNLAERLGWKQGYFAVDLDDEKGNTIGSLTYENPISSRTIIADIQEYYKTGKIPQKEE